ncbi:LPS translocon maturation chaperone LptM [Acinetobacter brisouii]|uniref:LPS translocon maturation chaperone LptM n=1 Tax=Acinetobacter brisouii TaxID=396323 RepID=UPI00125091F0
MMRQMIAVISLVATGLSLVGCGQAGDLQLPNDPHLDTRPKYLLYHPKEQPKAASEVHTSTFTPSSEVQ